MRPALKYLCIFLFFIHPVYGDSQDSLLNLLSQDLDDSTRVRVMEALGESYLDRGFMEEADSTCEEAIKLARTLGDQKLLADVLNDKGRLLRKSGQIDRSIYYLEEALTIADKLDDKHLLASICNNLGVSYRRKDDDNMGLKYHLEALRLAKEIEDDRLLSYAYNSIGIIYTYRENYRDALDYYKLALELSEKGNNHVGVAINLNSIAWVYESMGDYDKAIDFYKQSLEVNRENNNKEGIAICYNDIGKLYHRMGEYKLSILYYEMMLSIPELENDRRYVAQAKINIGQVYADLGDYTRSKRILLEGLGIALELKSKRQIEEAYMNLSRTCELLQDYSKALDYYKLASDYKDSISNEDVARRIAELRTTNELERKDQENLMLQKETAALDEKVRIQRMAVIITSVLLVILALLSGFLFIIRKNLYDSRKKLEEQNRMLVDNENKLNEALATRDKFFKIIAHDLRGNFNGILGFSDLLRDQYKNMDPDEVEDLIRQVSDASTTTYKLLENLLDWARVHTNEITYNPSSLSLKEIIESSLSSTSGQAENKGVRLSIDMKEDIKVLADKQMIYAVIRNLVSNAVKFSRKGNKVIVKVEDQSDRVLVSVIDEGVGIPPDKLARLFDLKEKNSTSGTSNEQGTGLGLLLCKEFVDHHGSELRVESEAGRGSRFFFELEKI